MIAPETVLIKAKIGSFNPHKCSGCRLAYKLKGLMVGSEIVQSVSPLEATGHLVRETLVCSQVKATLQKLTTYIFTQAHTHASKTVTTYICLACI